eukprot:6225930-Amphidinium_carterae.1
MGHNSSNSLESNSSEFANSSGFFSMSAARGAKDLFKGGLKRTYSHCLAAVIFQTSWPVFSLKGTALA